MVLNRKVLNVFTIHCITLCKTYDLQDVATFGPKFYQAHPMMGYLTLKYKNKRVKMTLNRSLKVFKSLMCCRLLALFKIIVEMDIKCILVCDL